MKISGTSWMTSSAMRAHCLAPLFLMLAAGLTTPCRASDLFVSNSTNNTIEKFTTSGVGSVFANTGLAGPGFLAFAPIPEPSTWAMFAIGVAALLLTKRLKILNAR
jgi:PEP-CTERM motif